MKSAAHRAFTLVELLVVIAIIGVLIAMVLPAVQASRESARRTQCVANLSQVSVGLQNYEMAHERYPVGTIDAKGPIHSVAQGDHRNWVIELLPHIDEANTYRHIDQSVGVYHPNNAAVRATELRLLVCPSYSGSDTSPSSNYAAVHHDVEAPIDSDNHGVFFLNTRVRRDDINDGPSHTLFIGEKLIDANDLGWMSGTRATLRNTAAGLNAPLPAIGVLGNTDPSADAAPRSHAEEQPAENYEKPTAGKNAVADSPSIAPEPLRAHQPTDEAASNKAAIADPTLFVGGFGSCHPAGVNFVFGDGSVRFIPETINLQILQQLAHRADGKLLPQADF